MGTRPDQRTDNSWAPVRNRNRLLQLRDCLIGLMVANKRPSKRPEGQSVVRSYRQNISELAYCLVIAMCVEQSPPDGMAGRSERVKIAGAAGPRQCLLHTSLAQQP